MMEWDDIGIKGYGDVIECIESGAYAGELHELHGDRIITLLICAFDKMHHKNTWGEEEGNRKEMNDESRIKKAMDFLVCSGGVDGADHKAWVIDQVLRILAGPHYNNIVNSAKAGEDGPYTYDWDVGIAP